MKKKPAFDFLYSRNNVPYTLQGLINTQQDYIRSAMIIDTTTLTIENSTLEGFFTTSQGAAVYSINSNVFVSDSNFTNN